MKPRRIVKIDRRSLEERFAAKANATVEVAQVTTVETNDETLATLFDPVTVPALEKMFPASGKWKSWAERADRNSLKNARAGRAKFNPYKAAMWFLQQGVQGWDLAHCYRVLANNLPARSRDEAYLLTGELN